MANIKDYYGFHSILNLNDTDSKKLDLDLDNSQLQENTIVTGIVIKVDSNFVYVDIGAKSESKIPISEFINDTTNSTLPQPGEKIEVFISKLEGKNGKLILSKTEALKSTIYNSIQKIYEENLPIKGTIISLTKAGYVVLIMNHAYAFLPGSQLELGFIPKDPASYVGKTFEFKILNIVNGQDNKKTGNNKNIIISRRAIFEEGSKLDKAKAIQYLTVNQVIRGKIKNIMSYGAFVTIPVETEENNAVTDNIKTSNDEAASLVNQEALEITRRTIFIDGLVHVTDISWERISHPSEKLNIGEELNFVVKDIDPVSLKVHLSIKLAQPNPWDEVEKEYAVGKKIIAKVTNISLNDSCAFLNLGNSIEGILPSNEISWSKSVNPRQYYFIGQEVEVLITEVDKINQKITLSVKQLTDNPWLVFVQDYKIGDKLTLKVDSIKPYGAFLSLIDKNKNLLKIEGLLHIYDISWHNDGQEFLSKLIKGDEVTCIINNIDIDKQKVSLGIKQLTEDPFKAIYETYKVGEEIEVLIKGRKDDYLLAFTKDKVNAVIPRSEISSIMSESRFDRFEKDTTVKSIILSVDRQENRIVVSIAEYERNIMLGK